MKVMSITEPIFSIFCSQSPSLTLHLQIPPGFCLHFDCHDSELYISPKRNLDFLSIFLAKQRRVAVTEIKQISGAVTGPSTPHQTGQLSEMLL